jgi:sugar lactone lactonase YvrE
VDLDRQSRIYIASYPRAIVRVDDLNGANKVEYRPDSPPGKVWVDSQGRIYWRDDLLRINRIDDISGANLVRFGGLTSGLFQAPAGIVTDSANRIYVIDTAKTRVSRFDDMAGANPKHYGSQGSGVGQFEFIFGVSARPIAIDNADRIYVADTENRRVVRFDAAAFDDPAAANWTVLDIPADASGNVFRPLSVAVDEAASPRIYLSGYYYNGVSLATINYTIVSVDDISGANLQRFGTKGSGSGQFDSPVALVVK